MSNTVVTAKSFPNARVMQREFMKWNQLELHAYASSSIRAVQSAMMSSGVKVKPASEIASEQRLAEGLASAKARMAAMDKWVEENSPTCDQIVDMIVIAGTGTSVIGTGLGNMVAVVVGFAVSSSAMLSRSYAVANNLNFGRGLGCCTR